MFETKTEKNNKLFFFMIYSQYEIFLKLKLDINKIVIKYENRKK